MLDDDDDYTPPDFSPPCAWPTVDFAVEVHRSVASLLSDLHVALREDLLRDGVDLAMLPHLFGNRSPRGLVGDERAGREKLG